VQKLSKPILLKIREKRETKKGQKRDQTEALLLFSLFLIPFFSVKIPFFNKKCLLSGIKKFHMGKISEGILGPVKGGVGPVVGSSWKGIPYLKKKYSKRTNDVSKKELANREKFGKAQLWLKPLTEFVRVGFKGYTPLVEGFVAAKSYLLKNAIEGDVSIEGVMSNISINPSKVRVSYGDLPLSDSITVRLKEPAGPEGKYGFEFNWDPQMVEGGDHNDQVMMLAYDIERSTVYFITAGQLRINGKDVLPLSPKRPTGTYHFYIAFNAEDRSRQSNSVYLGTITV
jgi:hypothetical protein